MKKVVKDIQSVSINNIQKEKYYGIKNVKDNCKGFINSRDYKGQARVVTTGGDSYDYFGTTLEEIVNFLLEDNNEVYEFDTSQDLFKWLMEK